MAWQADGKAIGRRLRSEAIINGRTLKEGHMEFARPGLKERKIKSGEEPGQKIPGDWNPKTVLPEKTKVTEVSSEQKLWKR